MKNKEIITINYKKSNHNKKLSYILKRKNSYYLKDEEKNTICKLLNSSNDEYILYIKEKNKWVEKGKNNINNVFDYLKKDVKKTICFSSDERKRLERGIYRYIESKCDFLANKEFEPKVRFGKIYFDFYVDDIFRINFFDKQYNECILDKKQNKGWKELKKGSFDEVMSFLNKYFKNHYINDEII
ncbi:MAG: hypothetical protein ACQESN_02835 [Thermotogota bacterium]